MQEKINELEKRIDSLLASLWSKSQEIKNLRAALIQLQNKFGSPPHVDQGEFEILKTLLHSDKDQGEFEILKTLLHSDNWPAAIDPKLICNTESEEEKFTRAEAIIDLVMKDYLDGLAFLDFGCGEGHVVTKSKSEKPRIALGYDIKSYANWTDDMTTDWDRIKENGPYNVILMYDVLDHMIGTSSEIVETLKKVKSILNQENGKLYVRAHPWTSRHGTHLYQSINKSYIHLVFTEEEIKEMGYEETPTRKTIHPLITYNDFFNKAGFTFLKKEIVTNNKLEPFFMNNVLVSKRIKKCWKNSPDTNLKSGRAFPIAQLEIQFIDFILR